MPSRYSPPMIVGVLGLVLASISISWQAASYLLTGGRVKVSLRVGGFGNGAMVTAPPASLTASWWDGLAKQGYKQPIVAVRVANVGRQPVTVARWGLKSGLGMSLYPMADSIGQPLPHRLEVGESETWAVDMAHVDAFIQAVREVVREPQPELAPGSLLDRINSQVSIPKQGIAGVVELADGRAKRSEEIIR